MVESLEQRINNILAQLSLQEKVSMLSGKDAWRTMPIERFGVPSLIVTDGPHGVRMPYPEGGRKYGPTTAFPTGVSMAASWNPDLVEKVGQALAEETLAMDCDILLGPCVNIVRHPLAGRNFESYSEDPYLAGQIGVAYVKGVQSKGVGTSLKHYALNNQEFERFRGSSEIDERSLREIYLSQFETIVKEANPWTVMCSYNRINGVYASENSYLLKDILKGEWGFEGVVVSDWTANHTITESVVGGLDLEMPGPARYYGDLLVDAVRNWQIDEEAVDDAVRRLLRVALSSGRADTKADLSGSMNTPEHQALAQELSEEAITLLKNDGILPLSAANPRQIAVIGPNARGMRFSGGGSSFAEPPFMVNAVDGLHTVMGEQVEIAYAQGCDNFEVLPVLGPDVLSVEGQGGGLMGEFFDNPTFSGQPIYHRLDRKMDFWFWQNGPVPDRILPFYSARWKGVFTPEFDSLYTFSVSTSGKGRLILDGQVIIDTTSIDGKPGEETTVKNSIRLQKGKRYSIVLEGIKDGTEGHLKLDACAAPTPPHDEDQRIEQAASLAAQADVAVVYVGLTEIFETEGKDRPHMDLPNRQNELIEAVAAANPKTVVVINAGSPVTMPWLDKVAAVVLAYYPGMMGGNAVARVLSGQVNPSGKLTCTYPVRLEDTPAFTDYPGGKQVRYGEGIFVGYRYYEKRKLRPLFPFGHGLSYTTFEYSNLEMPQMVDADGAAVVKVTIRNSGTRQGKEVVQLYVADRESSLARPEKELKGFAKVGLLPGESKQVEFRLDARSFAFYDPNKKRWVVEPGQFDILVGSSSVDVRLQGTIEIK